MITSSGRDHGAVTPAILQGTLFPAHLRVIHRMQSTCHAQSGQESYKIFLSVGNAKSCKHIFQRRRGKISSLPAFARMAKPPYAPACVGPLAAQVSSSVWRKGWETGELERKCLFDGSSGYRCAYQKSVQYTSRILLPTSPPYVAVFKSGLVQTSCKKGHLKPEFFFRLQAGGWVGGVT